jgi:hypothetical protein
MVIQENSNSLKSSMQSFDLKLNRKAAPMINNLV